MPIDNSFRTKAEDISEQHWKKYARYTDAPVHPDRIHDYISAVLPCELECAQSDTELPARLPDVTYQGGVLVLLVGFSIDPLLQSVCAYRPERVILLVNGNYGGDTGKEWAEYIARFITYLPRSLLPQEISLSNKKLSMEILDKDQPNDVFRKLRQVVTPYLQQKQKVVLDITGGKKSMVAGAFFFGAFAGVNISYVDFDEYDAKKRAPRGYTCRIGLLPNPYETFRLADWEEVRNLYQHYAFHNASQLLERLLPTMQRWFTEDEIQAAHTLKEIMKMYEFWDNGDYSQAWKVYQAVKPKLAQEIMLATAIERLGQNDYWPHGDTPEQLLKHLEKIVEGDGTKIPSLYLDMPRLLIYAEDEIARIDRLIQCHEDYRSALLRSVGLCEVLSNSRWLILCKQGKCEVAEDKNRSFVRWQDVAEKEQKTIRKTLIQASFLVGLLKALASSESSKKDDLRLKKCDMRRSSDAPCLPDELICEDEATLRNKAIHAYLSVPRSIAENVYKIARKHLDDFCQNWAPLLSKELPVSYAKAMEWHDICRVCKVDFLIGKGEKK